MVDFHFAMLDYEAKFGADSMDEWIHPVSADLLKAANKRMKGRAERLWFHARWEFYIEAWTEDEFKRYLRSLTDSDGSSSSSTDARSAECV